MVAVKIAGDYRAGSFSPSEAGIATDIFRILVNDVEKKVRKALADELCYCPDVPHDIIMRLAEDDADVSSSILEHSIVLTEEDLIAIVESTTEVLKLCAIARRDTVSEGLSTSLLNTRLEQVAIELFHNRGASISEQSLLTSWGFISGKQGLLETLVQRGGLPLTVAEKVYYLVSDDLKRHMANTYKIGLPIADKAANDAREWQLLGILPSGGTISAPNDDQVEDLIDQLYMGTRLTPSFLIRSLCVGALSIFEAGIARLAGVPRVNARILLLDSGSLGFQAIYKAANMPEGFYQAVETLVKISLQETEYGKSKRSDFRKRVIERIYKERYNQTVENMEYLLSIIGGKIGETDNQDEHHIHARRLH